MEPNGGSDPFAEPHIEMVVPRFARPGWRIRAAGGWTRVEKLLLLSMILATVAIPAVTARIPRADRALVWTVLLVLACSLVYVLLVTQVYVRHFVPEPFQP